MKRKGRVRAALVAAAVGVGGVASIAPAQAFTWINTGGGTYNVAANWLPLGPPTLAGHTAVYNQAASYTVTLSAPASHGTMTVANGTVTLAGATTSGASTLTLANGGLTVGGGVSLATSGAATINPGGALSIGPGGTYAPGHNLVVNGGSLFRSGFGGLNLAPGRSLVVQAGGTASLTGNLVVAGYTTTVTNGLLATTGYIDLGGAAGNGTLVINGANARAQTGNEVAFWGSGGAVGEASFLNGGVGTLGAVRLGADNSPGSSGRMLVDGSSVRTLGLEVGFGSGATGSVTINNGQLTMAGGNLVVGHASAGSTNGTVTIGGGTLTAAPVAVATINARGLVTVNAGGTFRPLGGLTVGGAVNVNGGSLALPAGGLTTVQGGGTLSLTGGSTLNVADGHLLEVTDGLVNAGSGLNLGASGAGRLNVSGPTARLTAGQLARVGGAGGTGTLLIQNGGNATLSGGLELASGHIAIAGGALTTTGGAFSVGSASATGSVTLNAGTLRVGNGLQVSPGSAVRLEGGNLQMLGGSLQINGGTLSQAAAAGYFPANNQSTVLTNGGRLELIDGTPLGAGGTLRVLSGSRVTNGGLLGTLDVGVAAAGTLEVRGAGSSVAVSTAGAGSAWAALGGNAFVTFATGAAGTFAAVSAGVSGGQAVVSVLQGAALATTGLAGGTSGGTATFLVDGAGSTLNSGSVTVGERMTLTIANGGAASFSQTVLTGLVQVDAGTANLGLLLRNGGSIDLLRGALIYGGQLATGSGGVLGLNPSIGPTRYVGVNGNAVLEPFSTLTLDGGELRVNTIDRNGGGFVWSAGTLQLGAPTTVDAAGPLGSDVVLPPSRVLAVGGPLTVGPGASLLQAGGGLRLGGTVDVHGLYRFDGGWVDAAGTVSVAGAGALVVSANRLLSVAGVVENAGVVELGGGAARLAGNGALANAAGGLILGDGVVAKPVANAGEVRADAGRTLRFLGGMPLQSGRINLLGGGVDVAAPLANAGSITGRGALATGGLTNTGTIQLSAGLSDVSGTLTNAAGGRTIVSGGAVASFYSPVTNAPTSEFRVSTGSTAVFFGHVAGIDRLTGTGTTVFEATTSPGALVNGGRGVVGPAGDLRATLIRQASLVVEGTARLEPGGAGTPSRLGELAIVGAPGAWVGLLDVADGALIIDYAAASPLAVVVDQLRQGYAGGGWGGRGIGSSVASPEANRAVGVAEAADLGLTAFLGDPVDATSLLLRYTLPGDATLDGRADIADFARLAANFNLAAHWATGDFNYDGTAGIADFALLAANFNRSVPPGAARAPSAAPEPTAWAIAAACGAWLAGNRRPRRTAQLATK